jgi:hypothetical protein
MIRLFAWVARWFAGPPSPGTNRYFDLMVRETA